MPAPDLGDPQHLREVGDRPRSPALDLAPPGDGEARRQGGLEQRIIAHIEASSHGCPLWTCSAATLATVSRDHNRARPSAGPSAAARSSGSASPVSTRPKRGLDPRELLGRPFEQHRAHPASPLLAAGGHPCDQCRSPPSPELGECGVNLPLTPQLLNQAPVICAPS